jgi:hypothetical protein
LPHAFAKLPTSARCHWCPPAERSMLFASVGEGPSAPLEPTRPPTRSLGACAAHHRHWEREQRGDAHRPSERGARPTSCEPEGDPAGRVSSRCTGPYSGRRVNRCVCQVVSGRSRARRLPAVIRSGPGGGSSGSSTALRTSSRVQVALCRAGPESERSSPCTQVVRVSRRLREPGLAPSGRSKCPRGLSRGSPST